MSSTKYGVLFQSILTGITISDSQGKIVESNPEAERLLGLSQEEQARRNIAGEEWDLIRSDGTPMPPEEFASVRALKEQRAISNVEMGIVKGEDVVWINVNAVPMPLEGYGVAITYADVTERKQAEEALQESETRFRTMFQESPFGIALIDSQSGRIYEVNKRFAEIAGRSQDELQTIDWMSITHPDDVQRDQEQMARMNAGKIPGFQMQKRYLRPDGSIVWVKMTIAPLKELKVPYPRHLCMIEDIGKGKQKKG